jgi:hypothetical protein
MEVSITNNVWSIDELVRLLKTMTETEFVLSRDQRDEIMKAVVAIRRQLHEMGLGKPNMPSLWVISSNLTEIQTNLTNLPRVNSN